MIKSYLVTLYYEAPVTKACCAGDFLNCHTATSYLLAPTTRIIKRVFVIDQFCDAAVQMVHAGMFYVSVDWLW